MLAWSYIGRAFEEVIIPRHTFYAAADPGHKGAIALMNASGTTAKVWPMPSIDGEIQYPDLAQTFKYLKGLPDVGFGIEWPQPFPGAFNNVIRDADNFGRQKGTLESFAYLSKIPSYRVSPVTWKGKLGLDGKAREGANAAAAAVFEAQYPQHRHLIRGPRGGLLDGPMDALLICHWMRLVSGACAASAVKGSMEHMAAVLSMGPGKRKLCRMPKRI